MKKKIIILSTLVAYHFCCRAQTAFPTIDSLTINNINAALLVHGDMFWNPALETSATFFPRGTVHNNNFAGSIWMGGYDASNNLHIDAQTYRQDGNDYWPGILDAADTLSYTSSSNWNKIWKVYKIEIDTFVAQATHDSASTPRSILTWPGKGNTYAAGAVGTLTMVPGRTYAPFVDLNGNGIYEPLLGEYPQIKGDEALWEVFTDRGPTHNQTKGLSLGMEVQLMVYGYNRGTLMDNVIYYSYKLTNYSANTYHNFRLTMWDDIDLGWYDNDYIGFDSTWRLGVNYNGTDCDSCGSGAAPNAYVGKIPISGMTLVHVGFVSANDATSYMPVACFDYYNNDMSSIGNPSNDTGFNYYMRDTILDGQPFLNDFMGPGIPSIGYGAGTPSRYVYPGNPADSTQWSECVSGNVPGDRRFLITAGDFTVLPGESDEITFAFITTCLDTLNACPQTSFDSIKIYADTAWGNYEDPFAPSSVTSVTPPSGSMLLFPNPAHDHIYLTTTYDNNNCNIQVVNTLGQMMQVGVNYTGGKFDLDISLLPPGVYVVQYHNNGTLKTGMFVRD